MIDRARLLHAPMKIYEAWFLLVKISHRVFS